LYRANAGENTCRSGHNTRHYDIGNNVNIVPIVFIRYSTEQRLVHIFFFLSKFMLKCKRHRSMPNSQRLILRLSIKCIGYQVVRHSFWFCVLQSPLELHCSS